MNHGLKIGCCGFPTAHGRYYNEFKIIEIQKTFYEPPKIETAIKWKTKAPEDFEFTLKAWQLITHEPSSPTYRRLRRPIMENKKRNYGSFKPTTDVFKAWKKIEDIARCLNAKIIVFQCPASFNPETKNLDNMVRFFKKIKTSALRFVWEPRGRWQDSVIKQVCQECDLIHCVDPFKQRQLYGDISYFRLHGIAGYRYRYTDQDLKRLLNLCSPERLTYVMFNNTTMWADALRFKTLCKTYHPLGIK